jgi:integrase
VEIELPRIHRRERSYLTEDPVESLIEATPSRYKVLSLLGSYLGLRWQELAGLRPSAVTMIPGQTPSLRVLSTIERSNGTYQVKEYGKSLATRRTLKMPAFVAEALACHLATFPSEEWVFTGPRGGFLRYDNFRSRVWEPATQAAGVAPLDPHELRPLLLLS